MGGGSNLPIHEFWQTHTHKRDTKRLPLKKLKFFIKVKQILGLSKNVQGVPKSVRVAKKKSLKILRKNIFCSKKWKIFRKKKLKNFLEKKFLLATPNLFWDTLYIFLVCWNFVTLFKIVNFFYGNPDFLCMGLLAPPPIQIRNFLTKIAISSKVYAQTEKYFMGYFFTPFSTFFREKSWGGGAE